MYHKSRCTETRKEVLSFEHNLPISTDEMWNVHWRWWTTIPITAAERHCHFLLVVEHLAEANSTTPYIWITRFLRRREKPAGRCTQTSKVMRLRPYTLSNDVGDKGQLYFAEMTCRKWIHLAQGSCEHGNEYSVVIKWSNIFINWGAAFWRALLHVIGYLDIWLVGYLARNLSI